MFGDDNFDHAVQDDLDTQEGEAAGSGNVGLALRAVAVVIALIIVLAQLLGRGIRALARRRTSPGGRK